MKKNKTIAYMLAATLLVGGTFVGTKALFNDVVDIAGELAISTGDVDLEVVTADTKWTLERNGGELKEGTSDSIIDENGKEGHANVEHPGKNVENETAEGNFANNLKNGDVLTKNVVIKNVGTLNATNLQITKNEESNMPTWVSVETGEIKKGNEVVGESTVIEPGETVNVELKLTINADGQHNQMNSQNSDDQENAVITLIDAWKLTANQTQKSEVAPGR